MSNVHGNSRIDHTYSKNVQGPKQHTGHNLVHEINNSSGGPNILETKSRSGQVHMTGHNLVHETSDLSEGLNILGINSRSDQVHTGHNLVHETSDLSKGLNMLKTNSGSDQVLTGHNLVYEISDLSERPDILESNSRSAQMHTGLNFPCINDTNTRQAIGDSKSDQDDARIVALQRIIEEQLKQISRLKTEAETKTNTIGSLQRKLSTQYAIHRKFNILKAAHDRLQKTHSDCARSLQEKFPSLHQDQITSLMRKSAKGLKWSPETIRDGLVMKMRCGTSAYSHLAKKIPIYPSVRSLRSYVQFINFDCGILEDIFNLMEIVVGAFSQYEKQCHLCVDEMAIEPGERLNFSTKKWVGAATFPSHTGIAKKGLVFLLAGVSRRWKQVVAVHLTNQQSEDAIKRGNSTGRAMANIVDNIIIRAEKIGLEVNGGTSDMGSDNLAWWKEHGICATRDGPVKCSFPHPARHGQQFYVFPDAPHLFKSIKKMLESNKIIRLPPEIVQEENLPSDIVDYTHIEDLCEFEGQFELKVAPQLKEENLHCKNHFSSMNVSTSRAVVNNRTGAGLKKLSEVGQNPSYLTTAWFVLLLNSFFQIVTSRYHKIALSKRDLSSYEKALNNLKKVSYVFRHMRVGVKGHWKPAQRGVLILVESILGLQEYYLRVKNYDFILLGHLTQDCLENLVSCIRLCQPIPNALAFLQNLKVITLAMYNSFVKGSNYEYEESSFMVDPLSEARRKSTERARERAVRAETEEAFNPVPQVTAEDLDSIPEWERCVIYDMAGSIIHSLKITSNTLCPNCVDAVLWKEEDPHPYSIVTFLKEYVDTKSDKRGSEWCQIQVSHECFVVILVAEVTFRKVRLQTKTFCNTDVLQYLTDGLMYVWESSSVPDCHNIRRKILHYYLRSRLKQYGILRSAELKAKNAVDKSSKSMAMRQVVRQL